MSNKKYDKKGRVVSDFITETKTSYKYKYSSDTRTIVITNKINRSNHTTSIKQVEVGKEKYRDVLKTECGDVYTTKTLYDEFGRQVRYEQINKKKKTSLIKTFHYPGKEETHIFIINYNGKKDFGFKADVEKLMGKC